MLKHLTTLFNDKQIKRFTLINVIILGLFVIVVLWKWFTLPNQLPLFYSLPRSADQLVTPVKILLLPLFSFIISVLNIYLAAALYIKEERLAAVILTAMSAASSSLLFLTFVKIVFLVT